jgi:hypothetical protein
MAQASSSKGNPAHKRMSNTNLKARRAASWARGQRRKAQRVKEQTEREVANAARRADGEPTPWERVKAARAARRAADPKVQKRAKKFTP